jgi:hypothetical protein
MTQTGILVAFLLALCFRTAGLGAVVFIWTLLFGVLGAALAVAPWGIPTASLLLGGLVLVAIPLAAGLSVVLVERLAELPSSLRSLRLLAILITVVLFSSSDQLAGLAVVGLELSVFSSPGAAAALSALVVSWGGAVVYTAVLSALALTLVQYVIRGGSQFLLAAGGITVVFPWPSLVLWGAIALAGLLSSRIAGLFWHELAPQVLAPM